MHIGRTCVQSAVSLADTDLQEDKAPDPCPSPPMLFRENIPGAKHDEEVIDQVRERVARPRARVHFEVAGSGEEPPGENIRCDDAGAEEEGERQGGGGELLLKYPNGAARA